MQGPGAQLADASEASESANCASLGPVAKRRPWPRRAADRRAIIEKARKAKKHGLGPPKVQAHPLSHCGFSSLMSISQLKCPLDVQLDISVRIRVAAASGQAMRRRLAEFRVVRQETRHCDLALRPRHTCCGNRLVSLVLGLFAGQLAPTRNPQVDESQKPCQNSRLAKVVPQTSATA